uniref:Magnesium transporter n=1 Tax=Haptolina brevifila TaxID=156173 RepID=A0A6U7CDN6_9EUKA
MADLGSHQYRGSSRLKVLQWTRCQTADAAPEFRSLTHKELLDEINREASTFLSRLLPRSPGARSVPTPPKRQASMINALKRRDVRKVDPAFATRLEPAILVRSGCIILSLGRAELRAIITSDHLYCVLRDGQEQTLNTLQANFTLLRQAAEAEAANAPAPTGATTPAEEESLGDKRQGLQSAMTRSLSAGSLLSSLGHPHPSPFPKPSSMPIPNTNGHANNLEEHLTSSSTSFFELCAVEAVLMTACSELTRRQTELSEKSRSALPELRRNVIGASVVAGSRQLDLVRMLKQGVQELHVQSQALEEVLREVLDEDEDLEGMYLTRRRMAVLQPDVCSDHEEVEMMLESYLQEVGATVAELDVLKYDIEATEKFVSFRLDSARNRLLKVDVIATASATALGVGQLVSGLFGMNVPSSLFKADVVGDDWLFIFIAGLSVAVVLTLITTLVLWMGGRLSRCCGWLDTDAMPEDILIDMHAPAVIAEPNRRSSLAPPPTNLSCQATPMANLHGISNPNAYHIMNHGRPRTLTPDANPIPDTQHNPATPVHPPLSHPSTEAQLVQSRAHAPVG